MKHLAVSTYSEYILIPVDEIIILEAKSNYTQIIKESGEILSSKSLFQYESKLKEHNHFIRVHDKFIVNTNYILKILKGKHWKIQTKAGIIPVSESRKNDLIEFLQLK